MTKSATRIQDKDTQKRVSVVQSKEDPSKYGVVILNPDGTPIRGKQGIPGEAATIAVGTTTTGQPGTSASVTNSGTSSAAVFNFTIPKGDTGSIGPTGNGIESVTSSKSGKVTTVTMDFTDPNMSDFSFTVSDGQDGEGSGDVIGPASSTDGHLAVFDGVTGKLIKDGGAVPAAQIQSDWNQSDNTKLDYIKNKPTLGTAASKNTGTSSGNVPVLDSNGKLATSTLPGVALTDTYTVTNKSDLTSLSSAEQGDIGIVTSESKTYVLSQSPYSTAANWKELLTPTDSVTSVNGQTGAVTVNPGITKVFTLPNDVTTAEALAVAQEAYDWYVAGNVSVLKKGSGYYYVVRTKNSGSELEFYQGRIFTSDNSYAGVTDLVIPKISLSISDGTVTEISAGPAAKSVLVTGVDYATPYTPEYDGSPATKKYVDDGLSGKQDALATQTAYTTKGTSTKVATISTNTLGQVTAITETSIAFPVTSVNGSTGAVTVNGFNPGGTATTGYVLKKTADGYGWDAESGAVTSVNGQTGAVTVAEVPTVGTNGQVLTVVSGAAAWANAPATGIQLAPNSPLQPPYHWYGTEAQYQALSQYYTDTPGDTVYYTV